MVIGPEGQIIGEKEGNDAGNKNTNDKGFCNIGQQLAIGIFNSGHKPLGKRA